MWQTSPMGPFDMWPTGGGGFEYFYGFIGGENNQWYPALYEGTTPVEPPKTPEEGYHLTEDLADHAIDWVRQQKALMPDKPFFMYFAPGATHAPHHVPEGVDREVQGPVRRRLGRAARAHVRAAEGAGRHPRRRRAHRAPRRDPRVGRHARRAEAGPRARDGDLRRLPRAHRPPRRPADRHASRSSASSTTRSSTSSSATTARRPRARQRRVQRDGQLQRDGRARDARVHDSKIDEFGAPESYNHYAVGWAWAMDTPYQWTKQVASHWGGTRNGTIVHWPERHRREGRAAPAVHPRHRRRPDGARSGRPPRADDGQRGAAVPDGGHEHALQLRRRRTRPSATTCSTSRCSATAASTTRAGAR